MLCLLAFVSTSKNAVVGMSFLILLDTMLTNPSLHSCLRGGKLQEGTSYIGGILKYMIVPNLVWKPGRVAAKIRKAACTVLLTIAKNNIATVRRNPVAALPGFW